MPAKAEEIRKVLPVSFVQKAGADAPRFFARCFLRSHVAVATAAPTATEVRAIVPTAGRHVANSEAATAFAAHAAPAPAAMLKAADKTFSPVVVLKFAPSPASAARLCAITSFNSLSAIFYTPFRLKNDSVAIMDKTLT